MTPENENEILNLRSKILKPDMSVLKDDLSNLDDIIQEVEYLIDDIRSNYIYMYYLENGGDTESYWKHIEDDDMDWDRYLQNNDSEVFTVYNDMNTQLDNLNIYLKDFVSRNMKESVTRVMRYIRNIESRYKINMKRERDPEDDLSRKMKVE
jgi:hypothetical protein